MKRTNNELQNTTQLTKDWAPQTPLITRGEPRTPLITRGEPRTPLITRGESRTPLITRGEPRLSGRATNSCSTTAITVKQRDCQQNKRTSHIVDEQGSCVKAYDTVICIHVAFNCKFCWYYQFLTRAQWLTLAQQNLRNAYRAADQQYRNRSRTQFLWFCCYGYYIYFSGTFWTF